MKHNHKQTRNGYSKKWRVNRMTRTKWKSDHKQDNNMTTGTQNKHKVMRNDPKQTKRPQRNRKKDRKSVKNRHKITRKKQKPTPSKQKPTTKRWKMTNETKKNDYRDTN